MVRASTLTAATLAGIAALHVGWGAGSSFPFSDPDALADTVAGTVAPPRAAECFGVAGLLLAAAGVVGDVLPIPTALRRSAALGVAVVLGGRGLAGVTGRTGSLVRWSPSERFVELDRRWYGPLCLLLAAGALTSVRS
jgi:hypothetical protein